MSEVKPIKSDYFQKVADKLRTDIVNAIREFLAIKNEREIQFNDALVYRVIDSEGENEVLSAYRVGNASQNEVDTITTSFYGADEAYYGVEDMTTDQLIWIFRQIETNNYDVFELDGQE